MIFSVGWNDTHQTHLPSYRLELVRHLLAIAERAEGQPIILLGMEPLAHQEYWEVPASRVNTANDTLQAALRDARKEGARFGIAFNAAFVDPRRPPVGNREPADGLHYTPRGARELYRRAQEKIEAMLGKQVSLDATPEVMLAEADTVECLSPPNTPGEKPGLSTARKL